MTRQYVRVVCNVACEWEGLPPIYRVYVNDELFTERWALEDAVQAYQLFDKQSSGKAVFVM